MIRHTVVFKFKDHVSSAQEQIFFNAVKELATIPGVQKLECLKQLSIKNNFDFGISMEFENPTLYEQYTNHPDHVHFVKDYWLKQVDDFLEIDYEPFV